MIKDIYMEISSDIPLIPANTYGDRAKFTAFGCVVVEQKDEDETTYRAVNMKTHKSIQLGPGSSPLTKKQMGTMAKQIGQSNIAGYGRLQAERPVGEYLTPPELMDILHEIFQSVLPKYGYHVREGQVELAEHILNTLCRRNISLAEAGVGIGKTHAYLIAAALVKRGRANDFWMPSCYPDQQYAAMPRLPVVVATSSIALQNAIIRDYIPEISSILMENGVIDTPLTAVLRKGKEHYICENRLHAHIQDADKLTRQKLEPLQKGGIDLDNMADLTPYIKRKICVSGACASHCPHKKACRYDRYMRHCQSDTHDFQITNQNYLLADVKGRAEGHQPLFPDHQAIIVDEAHKLLDTARTMYGSSLAIGELTRLARNIWELDFRCAKGRKTARSLADKLVDQDERIFALLEPDAPAEESDETQRFAVQVDEDIADHLATVWKLTKALIALLEERQVAKSQMVKLSAALSRLRNLNERADALSRREETIYWMEAQPDGTPALSSIPDNIGELLDMDLWQRGVPVVMTSGTLSAAGDFTHVKRELGLEHLQANRIAEISKPSPFNYKENALLYISEQTPFPDGTDRAYLTAVADEVVRLVLASHGHAAVLFTSYNAMGLVDTMLQERNLPIPLFRLGRGDRSSLEAFQASKNGVLLAAGTLWEGIDLPGDILSMLIIVKLPFAVPDPISQHEQKRYGDVEAFKRAFVVPNMLIKLMQGFGRLIRREDDTGAVAILDSRASRRGAYRDPVLQALPSCTVTDDVNVVEAFFQDRKAPGYYALPDTSSQVGNTFEEGRDENGFDEHC